MRYLQHDSDVTSVAFAPDGTLFALNSGGQLWAYPVGGGDRVLVAVDKRLSGMLEISPDGRWRSVSGHPRMPLARLTSPKQQYRLTDNLLYRGFHFSGDSTAWVGRAIEMEFRSHEFHMWRLPWLEHHSLLGATPLPCLHWAAEPGTSRIVLCGWDDATRAAALWRRDVAGPNAPNELLGTIDLCDGLVVGPGGRLFVSIRGRGFEVFTPHRGDLRRDLEVSLPQFENAPEVAVSADGRRFVARSFRNKWVYAGDAHTGELFGPWDWKIGQVNGVAVAPDGLTAAAAGSNKKLVVWDLE